MLVDTKASFGFTDLGLFHISASTPEEGLTKFTELIRQAKDEAGEVSSQAMIVPKASVIIPSFDDFGRIPTMGHELNENLQNLKSKGVFPPPRGQMRLHVDHSKKTRYHD